MYLFGTCYLMGIFCNEFNILVPNIFQTLRCLSENPLTLLENGNALNLKFRARQAKQWPMTMALQF